jgi:hypothetical protein
MPVHGKAADRYKEGTGAYTSGIVDNIADRNVRDLRLLQLKALRS